jgi:hypothetical protein
MMCATDGDVVGCLHAERYQAGWKVTRSCPLAGRTPALREALE